MMGSCPPMLKLPSKPWKGASGTVAAESAVEGTLRKRNRPALLPAGLFDRWGLPTAPVGVCHACTSRPRPIWWCPAMPGHGRYKPFFDAVQAAINIYKNSMPPMKGAQALHFFNATMVPDQPPGGGRAF